MDAIKIGNDQQQPEQPGNQYLMNPIPDTIRDNYRGTDKLKEKIALITGGDSGIGKSVALHFAREGADISIVYLKEDQDTEDFQDHWSRKGSGSMPWRPDLSGRL